MKKRKTGGIYQAQDGALLNSNFFHPLRNKSRISNIEKMLIIACRKFSFPELCESLKQGLGDQYTDKIAEKAFQKFVDDLRKQGVFDEMKQEYLEIKIQDERAEAELQRQEAADKLQPE